MTLQVISERKKEEEICNENGYRVPFGIIRQNTSPQLLPQGITFIFLISKVDH